jgi:hypothetical protein
MANIGAGALRDALVRLLRSRPEPLIESGSDAAAALRSRGIGDVLKAQVVAQLPNGRSIVEVEGAPFDVKLPVPARAGDTIELEVLALDPKPTFALKSPSTPLIELPKDAVPLPARALGQLVQAQVVAELPSGERTLEIEGARVDVKLPVNARVGDTLQLEVRSVDPRLTLALVGNTVAAPVEMSESLRRLATILRQIGASPGGSAGPRGTTVPAPILTSTMPAAATSASPLTIRDGAAPVSAAANTAAVHSATDARPIVAGPPHDTSAVAELLKLALTRSGLFYESHQAQWVSGERLLAELMLEPQAALKATGDPVHPQAVGIVRQQLEALDTRQIVWQGQVWPDQVMEWRVEEDRSEPKSAGEMPVWRTSLRLKLPRLGRVTALLALQGDEIRIAFRELDADTRTLVRDGQAALRDTMASAGLALLELKVRE